VGAKWRAHSQHETTTESNASGSEYLHPEAHRKSICSASSFSPEMTMPLENTAAQQTVPNVPVQAHQSNQVSFPASGQGSFVFRTVGEPCTGINHSMK